MVSELDGAARRVHASGKAMVATKAFAATGELRDRSPHRAGSASLPGRRSPKRHSPVKPQADQ
jgi:hypothetical protein